MKKNLMMAFSLSLICYFIIINVQVFAEPSEFEYYVSLQIDNNNYVNRYGLGHSSIQQIDKNDSSVKPFIHKGSTMLPMRAVVSILPIDGPPTYDVEWYESERKAVIMMKPAFSHEVILAEFWIGSNTAVYYDENGKNPKRVTIPSEPMIVNSRTYLPMRAVIDSLIVDSLNRYEIEWVPSKQGIVMFWFGEAPKNVMFPDGSRIEFWIQAGK